MRHLPLTDKRSTLSAHVRSRERWRRLAIAMREDLAGCAVLARVEAERDDAVAFAWFDPKAASCRWTPRALIIWSRMYGARREGRGAGHEEGV